MFTIYSTRYLAIEHGFFFKYYFLQAVKKNNIPQIKRNYLTATIAHFANLLAHYMVAYILYVDFFFDYKHFFFISDYLW